MNTQEKPESRKDFKIGYKRRKWEGFFSVNPAF